MRTIQIFEELAQKYDEWFEKNPIAYESEISALRKFIPQTGKGLEIGIGTGRFATPFSIKEGVEPAKAMAEIARSRGLIVHEAVAEELPFADESFDFIAMITTICFLQDPLKALREVKRILKPRGHFIIGLIDKASTVGKYYQSKKEESNFYRYANFYTANQILDWLKKLNFENVQACQTLFEIPEKITAVEPVKDGYGKGGFVVISAQKEVVI